MNGGRPDKYLKNDLHTTLCMETGVPQDGIVFLSFKALFCVAITASFMVFSQHY